MTATRPSFYVLDAFNLIFQVFHAIPEMTGPAGQPTQAVFGIYRDLLNLVRDRKPDYLAAAFDGPGRVFRSDIFEDYKATRKEMPVDLVPLACDILSANRRIVRAGRNHSARGE